MHIDGVPTPESFNKGIMEEHLILNWAIQPVSRQGAFGRLPRKSREGASITYIQTTLLQGYEGSSQIVKGTNGGQYKVWEYVTLPNTRMGYDCPGVSQPRQNFPAIAEVITVQPHNSQGSI